ncbi:hypothetical protein EZV62_017588 [Acer yangbiense]|uniref:Uncharacterized protein n=1 Tax=Acer yangbiense TaxID=1000413 RepID=A0A5C7HHR2_9ROSI|nr:hypothetical protein EZV62_017588 [Acer yangbiense]
MGSEGPKAVTIHVTGFKKFLGVDENPTETMVNNLKIFLEKRGLPTGVRLGSCTVLETAGIGALPMLHKILESSISTIVPWAVNKLYGSCSGTYGLLHFGVNSGQSKFAIEQQAVNTKPLLVVQMNLDGNHRKCQLFPRMEKFHRQERKSDNGVFLLTFVVSIRYGVGASTGFYQQCSLEIGNCICARFDEMGSEGPKAVTIHVTGFKKFLGVNENPTETMVNNLKIFLEKRGLPAGVRLGSCTVLETAGIGALPMLHKILESSVSSMDNEQIVWLHFGVNSGQSKFAIEQQAVNEATFGCPDEFGWRPQTLCSTEAILEFLKKKGCDANISRDAGRFVCNYVYYQSLRFAEQKGHKSLFVHVPLFSSIDEQTQMKFIATLLEAIASTC